MPRILYVAFVLAAFTAACDSQKSGGEPAAAGSSAAAAKPAGGGGDVSCDAVVAKFVSFDSSAGDPEKKLWAKACADMPPAVRSCIVGAKSKADGEACMKNEKLVK